MEDTYPTTSPKSGQEHLTLDGQALDFSLLDFWRWSVSDVLSNATRGRLAEFIVATATGFDRSSVRDEWDLYDLKTPEGIKVEVKSAAFVQTWHKPDQKPSVIAYGIKETDDWVSPRAERAPGKRRWADVYVFCLLHHSDRNTIDPLDMNQWRFYVVATQTLNAYPRSNHSITLTSLERMTSPVDYAGLAAAIREQHRLNDSF
jgi:hypothetical protein